MAARNVAASIGAENAERARTFAEARAPANDHGGASGPPSAPGATLEETCEIIVRRLKESCRINFLAIDFDLTFINQHTGGRWQGTAEELAVYVRPFFRVLVPMAIRAGIYVAIVTFTPQTGIVRQVLRTVLPDYAEQIPLRGEDGTWEYDGVGQTTGKQAHMASAVEELTLRQSASITRGSSLLIDDDARNIQVALLSQVRAVWMDPADIGRTIGWLLAL